MRIQKTGFTLAEVLLTLAIIGVTAALTAPALVKQSSSAKIGPRLQKSVSTFETAVENLLTQEDASSLTTAVGASGMAIGNKLSEYMKIVKVGDTISRSVKDYAGDKSVNVTGYQYNSADGVTYYINVNVDANNASLLPHKKPIGNVVIDTNGANAGPNAVGKDLFKFTLFDDGTLKPWGLAGEGNAIVDGNNTGLDWNTDCNGSEVTKYGWACAGSIFANDLKVIYR